MTRYPGSDLPAATPLPTVTLVVEFLGIIALAFLGFLWSLPKSFSRRPGAMIFLAAKSLSE